MSKKKKGMSAEEKRTTILGIYHKRAEVFNLKEIEKLASEKGVVTQSVKDINKELVDDNLVDSEKIGSGVYFWAFPSKRFQQLTTAKEAAAEERDRCRTQQTAVEAQIDAALATRTPTETRKRKLAELAELRTQDAQLAEQEAHLQENDPKVIAELTAAAAAARDAANRWTDNVWEIKSWCVKKKNMDPKQVDRLLEMPADFDYIV